MNNLRQLPKIPQHYSSIKEEINEFRQDLENIKRQQTMTNFQVRNEVLSIERRQNQQMINKMKPLQVI